MPRLWRCPEFHINNNEILSPSYYVNAIGPWILRAMALRHGLGQSTLLDSCQGCECGADSRRWWDRIPWLLTVPRVTQAASISIVLTPALYLIPSSSVSYWEAVSPQPPHPVAIFPERRAADVPLIPLHFISQTTRELWVLTLVKRRVSPPPTPNPWEIWVGWKMWIQKLISKFKSQGNRSESSGSVLRVKNI